MESVIIKWLKYRKSSLIVRRVTARGVMTIDHIGFRDYTDRNWSLGVVYSSIEIIGGIESWGNERLVGFTGEQVGEYGAVVSQPFEVLDSLVRELTWEELQSYDPKVPDKTQMFEWNAQYYKQKMDAILGSELGNFKVDAVNQLDGYLVVHFSWCGRPQYPLSLHVLAPSVIRRRNYGTDTLDYNRFVSKIGSCVGNYVWG